MSVVIVIVGLLAASALTGAEIFIERTRRDITIDRLADIKAALEEYRSINGYYPCPASKSVLFGAATFGRATDCNAAVAAGVTSNPAPNADRVRAGAVPFRDLNLPASHLGDSWDGKFTYAVTKNLAIDAAAYAANDGGLEIYDGATPTSYSVTSPEDQGAWIVVSHGRNRVGAVGVEATAAGITCTGAGLDRENCDNDVLYHESPYNNGENAGALFFDDYIIWGMKPSAAAGGGSGSGAMNVYTSDGATLIGPFLGFSDSSIACPDIIYSDPVSGEIKFTGANSCDGSVGATVYFTGANCTSTPYILDSDYIDGKFGYGCTGSTTCTTGRVKGDDIATSGNRAISSSRSTSGVCYTTSGSLFLHRAMPAPAICGAGPCVVKP